MRFKVVTALAAGLLLLVGSVVLGASFSQGDSANATARIDTATAASRAALSATDRRRHPGDRAGDRPGKGPNEAWKRLSPAEKSDTMRRLAREHRRGMRAWAACRASGRDDCVRPLPPGLAKRR